MIKTLFLAALTVIVQPNKTYPWLGLNPHGSGYIMHNPKKEDIRARFWCGMDSELPMILFHPGDTAIVFKTNTGETASCVLDDWFWADTNKK